MIKSEHADESESLPFAFAILSSDFDSFFLSFRQLTFQCPSSLQ